MILFRKRGWIKKHKKHYRAENRERRFELFRVTSWFGFRRIHGREKHMVAGEPELLQGERRGAAKRVEQQPQHLQENGATAENEHVQIRRRSIVQHYPVDIHFTKVIGRERFARTTVFIGSFPYIFFFRSLADHESYFVVTNFGSETETVVLSNVISDLGDKLYVCLGSENTPYAEG